MEPSAARAEDDSGDTGFREKSRIGPRRHSDEFLCGIRTESFPNRVADESHDRRIGRNFVCWTRAESAYRGAKLRTASGKPRDKAAQFNFEFAGGFIGQHSALQLQTAFRGIARKFLGAANQRSMKRTVAKKRMRRERREFAIECI